MSCRLEKCIVIEVFSYNFMSWVRRKVECYLVFTYVRRLVLMKWKLMFRIHSSRGVFMRLVNGQKIGCPSRMHECWSPLKINEDYILTWCPIHPSLLDETSNGELPKRKNKIKEFWMMDHPDFFFFFFWKVF